jgi:hypothetical protein
MSQSEHSASEAHQYAAYVEEYERWARLAYVSGEPIGMWQQRAERGSIGVHAMYEMVLSGVEWERGSLSIKCLNNVPLDIAMMAAQYQHRIGAL